MNSKVMLGTAMCCGAVQAMACTGLSLTARDGSYVQARTIEAAAGALKSEYVIIPRGQEITSFTPTGINGLMFTANFGVVGMSVVMKEFICEGVNEAGLSAGLFFFPEYGQYQEYSPSHNDETLGDLQVPTWILTQFASIDEVKEAIGGVRIVGLDRNSVVHYRIGEPSGRQVVLEIVDGVPHFYENTVGVLTNAPGFQWHVTNLNNYVNLFPGAAPDRKLGDVTLKPIGGNSGFLGLPGDATPPSRFVRIAFYRATAPQLATGHETVLQCFHILNNFDIPIGIEHPAGEVPDIPSATQWTSAIDLTHRKVYYKTAYDNSIRCIDLSTIDFGKVKYQSCPMDEVKEQPIQYIVIK
ncbi:MAG: choloylglycine hydrolase family protein [Muribaculaceae bacterium]|nr:choloylglycine hydrolase family protein [Muribaculaceae bacterium]